MKVSVLIEEGVSQVVLTPENDWETNVLKSIKDAPQSVKFFWGSFAECRGGWIRDWRSYDGIGENSLMLVLRPEEKKPAARGE